MTMEIEGKIIHKLSVQTGTTARGNWSKQEFVIEYQEGMYPTQVCLNVWGEDKVRDLEKYNVGDTVKVSYNLSSREYNGRWYTDVRAWRIEKAGAAQPDQAAGAVAGGAGFGQQPVSAQSVNRNYEASAGNYSAPTGAPLPGSDDMSLPADDLPF